MRKVLADNTMANHFDKPTIEIHKDKLAYFIGYMAGGHSHWIGQSLQQAHKGVKITDQMFDQFVSYCVQAMKEMRVKQDCLRETV